MMFDIILLIGAFGFLVALFHGALGLVPYIVGVFMLVYLFYNLYKINIFLLFVVLIIGFYVINNKNLS
jgi:hypothetical protein